MTVIARGLCRLTALTVLSMPSFFSTTFVASATSNESCNSETKIKIPTLSLSNGVEMPQYAAGTAYRTGWVFRPDFAYRAINRALDAGITHIDTALVYRSQKPIGAVLGARFASYDGPTRGDIFVTTKVFHPQFPGVLFTGDALHLDTITPEEVTREVTRHVERCLHELDTGYIDLLLLHWPGQFSGQTVEDNRARRIAAWNVLEKALESGFVRSIGVSNFSPAHLDQLMEDGAVVRPMVNQIETSVFMRHEGIIRYCQEHGIVVMAYSPLGAPEHGKAGKNDMLEDGELVRMGHKYGVNTGIIAMRYLVQRGIALTALSTSADRLNSNLDVFTFALDDDDMAVLEGLNKNKSMLGLVSPYDIN